MENLRKWAGWLAAAPWLWTALAAAGLITLWVAGRSGGDELTGFIGGSLLTKAAGALTAGIVFMALLWVFRHLRGLVGDRTDPVTVRINGDPFAALGLRALYIAAAAAIVIALMGFAPAPAHGLANPGQISAPASITPPPSLAPAFTRDALPARYARCQRHVPQARRAVARYWPAFNRPMAWVAQLYQESLCDPSAVSPAGARGLAQFMPATWREMEERFGVRGSPHDDIAVEAGALYQARMMAIWSRRDRPVIERWRLGLASYNAGAGNIIRAQTACGGARDWRDIEICLPQITGRHANETRTYVERIELRWLPELEA